MERRDLFPQYESGAPSLMAGREAPDVLCLVLGVLSGGARGSERGDVAGGSLAVAGLVLGVLSGGARGSERVHKLVQVLCHAAPAGELEINDKKTDIATMVMLIAENYPLDAAQISLDYHVKMSVREINCFYSAF